MRRTLFALGLGMLVAMVFAGAALALDLTGTEDRDKLIGSTGADTIDAKGGADRVWAIGGGQGTDAEGNPVYDVVRGGSGGDTLYGDADPTPYFTKTGLKNRGFTGVGDPGSDKLVGGFGADTIDGGPGDDYLAAGKGEREVVDGALGKEDVLKGGPGADEFWVDEAEYNADIDRIDDLNEAEGDSLNFYVYE